MEIFVQRGEISFLDKWEKTQINLEYGVNLVTELPLYYSIQNAEIFFKDGDTNFGLFGNGYSGFWSRGGKY